MEAIELYREETAKIKEHRAICRAAGKEVSLSSKLCTRESLQKKSEGLFRFNCNSHIKEVGEL